MPVTSDSCRCLIELGAITIDAVLWWYRLLNGFNKNATGAVLNGAALVSSLNKNMRGSKRVFVSLRLRVSAPTERGEEFLGEGQTVEASQKGASIMLDRDLRVGQTVKIRRVGVQKEALARVVALHNDGHRPKARVFGIALTDYKSDLWDIVFPPPAETDNAVLRALLRCVACGRLEVSHLNEFESDLLLSQPMLIARSFGPLGQVFSSRTHP